MNRIFFLTILLISAAVFSAEGPKTYIQSDGIFHLLGICDSADFRPIIYTVGDMYIHMDDPITLQQYKNQLMKIPTILAVTCSQIISIIDHNPTCAEQMLYEFISPDYTPNDFAFLAAAIGEKYIAKKMYKNASIISRISYSIVPNAMAANNIVAVYKSKQFLQATAYWIAKYTQKGFIKDTFQPHELKTLCSRINAQPNQKTDFKKDLKKILKWESKDLYNPALLLEYKD